MQRDTGAEDEQGGEESNGGCDDKKGKCGSRMLPNLPEVLGGRDIHNLCWVKRKEQQKRSHKTAVKVLLVKK